MPWFLFSFNPFEPTSNTVHCWEWLIFISHMFIKISLSRIVFLDSFNDFTFFLSFAFWFWKWVACKNEFLEIILCVNKWTTSQLQYWWWDLTIETWIDFEICSTNNKSKEFWLIMFGINYWECCLALSMYYSYSLSLFVTEMNICPNAFNISIWNLFHYIWISWSNIICNECITCLS